MRIRLPARAGSVPVVVELEYTQPRPSSGDGWAAPVVEGGIVQQTSWEVRLPYSRALVGVPSGWADENEWYWDAYVWKRRPWRAVFEAAARPGGAAVRSADPARGDGHSYLFSRPGAPVALPVFIASRAWLVAVCSGTVLAVGGFLILVWRPPVKLVWAAAAVLGLSVAALLHPSVTFLGVQSGMVGILLTGLIALMQSVVERRRGSAAFTDPSGLPLAGGSTFNRTVGVGSDDSTAIRTRPVSTMDYAPANAPGAVAEPPVGAPGRSSRSERAGRGGLPT
jgi:hypothetical protein